MINLKFGYDDNLNLPSDFKIKDFEYKSYHALERMIEDFENGDLTAIFMPAGTLPYLTKPFEIISQATLGEQRTNILESIFCSGTGITLESMATSTLGRINKFCTTSFWAPLFYLMENIKSSTLHFKETAGFNDLLTQVVKKNVDGGMVWKIILNNNPHLTSQVSQLFAVNNLPSPLIIAQPHLDLTIKHKLCHFHSKDEESFFNGFTTPDLQQINEFHEKMLEAKAHFLITT